MMAEKFITTDQLCERVFIKCLYSAYYTVRPSWRYSDSKTEYFNLVLVCGGRGHFVCNDRECDVEKGDIIYFPCGAKRSMMPCGEDLTFRSINFVYSTFASVGTTTDSVSNAFPLDFKRKISDKALFNRIEYLFRKIHSYYTMPEPSSAFRMRYYATELLYLLISGKNADVSFSDRNMVDDSLKFISDNFDRKITLGELAQKAGLSVSYYGKVFKKALGTTPMEYLMFIRISYAKDLLAAGISVSETAERCGFSSLYHFSKTFKQREGIPPTEYASVFKR